MNQVVIRSILFRRAAAFLLLFSLILPAAGLGSASTHQALDALAELGRPNAVNFPSWYQKDKELLHQHYKTIREGHNQGPILFKQWMALNYLMQGMSQSAAQTDPDTGILVYTAEATGVLQVLGLALRAREAMLARMLQAQLANAGTQLSAWELIYPPIGKGGPDMLFGADGMLVSTSSYINPQLAVNAIKDLMRSGVPLDAFTGAAIFIAPFAFPTAEDGGFVRATPGVSSFQAVIASTKAQNHPAGTTGHLFGHYVLARYFGLNPEASPENWKRYLALRGSSPQSPREWTGEGEWDRLTVENWAEDFRIAFGTNQSQFAHRGSYGQPKAKTITEFQNLVKAAISGEAKSISIEHVQITDSRQTAWAAGGLHTNTMVTTSRSLTMTGHVNTTMEGRPKIVIYGRRNPKERWATIGGGRTNQLGQFQFPLFLGPGAWEIAVEAVAEGLWAEENFYVIIITRQLAGEFWQLPQFTDLQDHWARKHVERLVELGAVSGFGDGTFRPEDPISRGAFVKVMMSALKGEGLIPERFMVLDQPLYEDLAEHWSRAFVEEAYANALFNTTEYFPRFQPDRPITREEIGRLVGAAIEAAVYDFGETRVLRQFADYESIEAWRTPAIATAVRHGILTGYPDGTFKPKNTATRAEASVIVVRLLEKVKELKEPKDG